MEDFVAKGMVEPYRPKGVEKLEKKFVHPAFQYVGIDMYIAAFCVNPKVEKEKGLFIPKGWNDLLDPKFKGLIAMPNPAASRTGFLQISSILQMYGAKEGKEDGWEFLKKLDQIMGEYIKSGSRPATRTASGEFAVGASFDFVVAEQKKQGFPVEFVFPIEGAGYEAEANGLLKGAPGESAWKSKAWRASSSWTFPPAPRWMRWIALMDPSPSIRWRAIWPSTVSCGCTATAHTP